MCHESWWRELRARREEERETAPVVEEPAPRPPDPVMESDEAPVRLDEEPEVLAEAR